MLFSYSHFFALKKTAQFIMENVCKNIISCNPQKPAKKNRKNTQVKYSTFAKGRLYVLLWARQCGFYVQHILKEKVLKHSWTNSLDCLFIFSTLSLKNYKIIVHLSFVSNKHEWFHNNLTETSNKKSATADGRRKAKMKMKWKLSKKKSSSSF